jgi:phage-related protein
LTQKKVGQYWNRGAAKFPTERVWHMSERHAEWEARAEECQRNASMALDAARRAVSDQVKDELVQVAAEWTRLAAAIVDAFLL